MMPALELDNPFWRFSLAVYSAPGISTECLALQEAIAIDVNLLLFCAWLGAERQVVLTRADIDEISANVRVWHERIVRPLRGVRQALKIVAGDTPLRAKVKGIELEAEQIEQAMLYAQAVQRWPQTCMDSPRRCVSENVHRLIAIHGSPPQGGRHWPTQLVETAIARHDEKHE
jgi:uncharacterized protein (TIGR02444 family)